MNDQTERNSVHVFKHEDEELKSIKREKLAIDRSSVARQEDERKRKRIRQEIGILTQHIDSVVDKHQPYHPNLVKRKIETVLRLMRELKGHSAIFGDLFVSAEDSAEYEGYYMELESLGERSAKHLRNNDFSTALQSVDYKIYEEDRTTRKLTIAAAVVAFLLLTSTAFLSSRR